MALKGMMKEKNMTYSEYRSQFKSDEEFKRSFGKLTEEEARALISAENTSVSIKAAIFTTWKMAKKEAEGKT